LDISEIVENITFWASGAACKMFSGRAVGWNLESWVQSIGKFLVDEAPPKGRKLSVKVLLRFMH